jgi:hypothetical protein
MATDLISAADGFVLAMLGAIVLSFGVIALLFWCMRRSASSRDSQVDALLDELAEDEKRRQKRSANTPQVDPWERDGDWWKQP